MLTCSPRLRSVARWCFSLLVLLTLLMLLVLIVLLPMPKSVAATPALRTVYVKPGAADGNNGASWETARSLQSALADSVGGDEIWVATGVYYPDEGAIQTNNSPTATFQLKNNVALYGGFVGTETSREQRDPNAHVSVLSGDIDNNDINQSPTGAITDTANITGTNAFHVVTGSGTDSSAILDGFTISAGSATNDVTNPCDLDPDDCGGGINNSNGSPTLSNLIISGNLAYYGGGLYNFNSNPSLTHVTFSGNQAINFGNGGGLYNDNSSPTLTNVTFTRNKILTGAGGGMYNINSSSPTLTSVTFIRNLAYYGGGMGNLHTSNPTLTNVTFSGNRAQNTFGGGMANFNVSNPILINVIFSGNRSKDHGGAIWNNNSSPRLTNVTFSGNQAGGDGGSMYSFTSGTPTIQNSIMWNNVPNTIGSAGTFTPTIRYSLFEGMNPAGTGNLDGTIGANAPLFVRDVDCGADGCTDDPVTPPDESANDDYGDLRLEPDSAAIDAGDNDADLDGKIATTETIADITTDIAGQPRIVAAKSLPARVDLGAYERATPPIANAGGPYTINEGSALALNGAASSDDFGPIVSFAWDCTNDGTVDVTSASPINSTCTYPSVDGTYTLRLTVADQVNLTGTTTTTVTVVNVAPTYTLAANQSTFAGSATHFILGTFSDPGDEGNWAVTVNWGDNSTPTQFTVNSAGDLADKSHTYAAQGTYNVVVSVNDGKSNGAGGFQVVVNPLPAGAPAVTAPADQTATVGAEQSFTLGSFTDAGSSGPWQVSVNWSDGSAATLFSVTNPGELGTKTHTYATASTYGVVVTVSDGVLAAGASFRIVASAEPSTPNSSVFLPAVQRP